MNRRSTKIAIDLALAVGFVLVFLTREGPDYAVHSWIGIVLVPLVIVHLASNAGWIRRVASRGRADRDASLALLNLGLGALTTVCIITGFPIWLEWSDHPLWTDIHTLTGMAAIVLAIAHVWRNRSRLRALLRRGRTPLQTRV